MSNTPLLPACCHALSSAWPWQTVLPGTQWISVRFDRQRFDSKDFQHCAIPASEAIQRASSKRQAEYLAGRLCAREALRQLTGIPQVPAITTSRAPLWPTGLVGSITHSGDFAAALVASEKNYVGIGLDAERLLDTARAERLASQILTPMEQERMATLPRTERGHFVTLVFSFKESLFKALFPIVGVRFYFQDAQLVSWDQDTQQATLCLRKTLAEDWPSGSQLSGQYVQLAPYLISHIFIPA